MRFTIFSMIILLTCSFTNSYAIGDMWHSPTAAAPKTTATTDDSSTRIDNCLDICLNKIDGSNTADPTNYCIDLAQAAESGECAPADPNWTYTPGDAFNVDVLLKNMASGLSRVAMVGIDSVEGQFTSALCLGLHNGNIPGKTGPDGKTSTALYGSEVQCQKAIPIGTHIYEVSEKPSDCYPRGFNSETREFLYSVIVTHAHGETPGFADQDLIAATFTRLGVVHTVTNNFKVVC